MEERGRRLVDRRHTSARTDDSDSNSLDFSTRPVPPGQRTSKGALTMAWWAVSSAVFYIVVAAALAQGFGAVNAIIGMLLPVVVYSIVNGIISRYAIKTGLSVALFSRILFGKAGAALATLIFFVTAIYYAVFEGSVIAVGIHTVFDRLFGRVVEVRSDRIPAFNPCGLTAWFAGAAIGLGLQQMGGLTASFSAPATAFVAAGLYYGLLMRAQPGWFVKGAA
jgi:cytosine/uracil/thiamine/allantoin permease